jgi:Ca2+-binding RTX toxin-like protein
MSIGARWLLVQVGTPSSVFPYLSLTGTVSRYVINWGDGTDSVVKFDRDDYSNGLYAGNSPFHQYYMEQGQFNVTIKIGRSDLTYDRLSVTIISDSVDDITVSGSNKTDYLYSGSGDDLLKGGAGDDLLRGGAGNDRLIGGGINVRESDNDQLFGGMGNDILLGRGGDDYLVGSNGKDRLVGGTGADTFALARPVNGDGTGFLGSDADRDIILDFQSGVDVLDVTGWHFRRDFVFIDEEAFNGSRRSELRADYTAEGNTILSGDWNGDGGADFSVLLIGVDHLTSTDFIL